MPVTLEDVRAALVPDEPQYAEAAQTLGREALPHLATLVAGDDVMLASKATYLASMVDPDDSENTVRAAADNSDPIIRVAAAGAARNLTTDAADGVLTSLLDDGDVGIRKVALRSVPDSPSQALRDKIARLNQDQDAHPALRSLSQEILDR